MSDDRSASDSRCCRPTGAPYEWHSFEDDTHYAVAELDDWLTGLPRFARENELGRIDELFETAAAGQIVDVNDDAISKLKPIRHDPELWELRHRALSKPLRFYHAEPALLPSALVKLHRHIKSEDIDQQEQIEYASERFQISDADDWEFI